MTQSIQQVAGLINANIGSFIPSCSYTMNGSLNEWTITKNGKTYSVYVSDSFTNVRDENNDIIESIHYFSDINAEIARFLKRLAAKI